MTDTFDTRSEPDKCSSTALPNPPETTLSSSVTTRRYFETQSCRRGSRGLTQRALTTPHDTFRASRLEATFWAISTIRPTARINTSSPSLISSQTPMGIGVAGSAGSDEAVAFGNRMAIGPSWAMRGLDHPGELMSVGRGAHHHVRDHPQVGEVEYPVMGGTIRSRDAGAVDQEHHGQVVKGNVGDHLVEGALQKTRVDGDHRPLPGHGYAGGERDGVLLGDSGIDHPLRHLVGHFLQTGGRDHRGRNRNDIGIPSGDVEDRTAGDVGQFRLCLQRSPGGDIETAGTVELVDLVSYCGPVTETLFGHHMDDDRLSELPGLGHGRLEEMEVMAIDPTGVLQTEGVENRGWLEDLLEGFFETIGHLVGGLTDQRQTPKHPTESALGPFVSRVEAVMGQVGEGRQSAHGWRIRTAVVVDDDHQVGRSGNGDVVEGLVGHASGQGTIADHRNRPIVGMSQSMSQGVGQGGGSVTVFDEVMGTLGPAWITGHPSVFAKRGKAFHAPSHEFVYIRLVADVPDDPIVGAVERPVQGDRQLDNAEVRAQMPAGPGDLLDQEIGGSPGTNSTSSASSSLRRSEGRLIWARSELTARTGYRSLVRKSRSRVKTWYVVRGR